MRSAAAFAAAALVAVGLGSCGSPRLPTDPGLVDSDPADWSVFGERSFVDRLGEVRLGPIASQVRWSPDSSALLWVAEVDDETRRLEIVGPRGDVLAAGDPVQGPIEVCWLQDRNRILQVDLGRSPSGSVPQRIVVLEFVPGSGELRELYDVSPAQAGVGSTPDACRVSGRIVSVHADRLIVARPDVRPPAQNPTEKPDGGPWEFDPELIPGFDRQLASPAWAPDGSGAVFVSGGAIYEVDSVGREGRRISEFSGRGSGPVVHPDLDEVWFTTTSGAARSEALGFSDAAFSLRPRLMRVQRDGSQPAELVAEGAGARFSPDGAWIGFTRPDGRVCIAPTPR